MKARTRRQIIAVAAITLFLVPTTAMLAGQGVGDGFQFIPGDLVVSRSVYTGTPATVTIGQMLPGGGMAIANGAYPDVFNNNTVDGSFGVTAPIFLDQLTPSGTFVNSLALPTDQITTSFSSKSELSINQSANGQSLTLMGYVALPNTLDVSNSNTPGVVDSTNPVKSSYYRAVAQVDPNGNVQVTPVNAYSGNNGRAVILANGNYYLVGNAGNGSGTPTNIVSHTGVQMATPGGSADTTVVGTQQGTPGESKGFQYGYSVTQYGYPADKSGKDDNFRGERIFNNTLYVTKGSGGNGINTVFQVGNAGSLPTLADAANTPITILPGFPTFLASATTASYPYGFYPFGIWFANATTLYVAVEGDGKTAHAATDPNSGLQKWILVNGTWQLAYTLQNGLNLGQQYSVPGYPAALNPATDGLRNITGKVNGDGTVSIYAVTSTVSASGDQGADPNLLIEITDKLAAVNLPAGETFTTLYRAGYGEVLRGVSFAPVPAAGPEPSPLALIGGGLDTSLPGRR